MPNQSHAHDGLKMYFSKMNIIYNFLKKYCLKNCLILKAKYEKQDFIYVSMVVYYINA